MVDVKEISKRIKFENRGRLSPTVYQEIYLTAARATSSIIEIGTAEGAATIALALGAPATVHIHTVDPMNHPDHIKQFDTPARMRKHVIKNFNKFGCEKKITHYFENPFSNTHKQNNSIRFDGMLLDADGALDRDFKIFYDNLKENAFIIIDDYEPERVRFFKTGRNQCRADQKHRISSLFVDYFEKKELIRRKKIVGETWFGEKSSKFKFKDIVPDDDIFGYYRSLIFASGLIESQRIVNIKKFIRAKSPALYRLLYEYRSKVLR